MSRVVAKVNGQRFEGWKTASIKRSIEAISGSFDLSVTDEWGEMARAWRINAGDSVVVELEGETVITGYVDKVSSKLSASSRDIAISGRDKAADLVDCSVPTKPTQFRKQTILQIAQKIGDGLGISFMVDGVDSQLTTFCTHTGESIFEALERAARKKGMLLTSDGTGIVRFTTPSVLLALSRLQEGRNLLAVSTEVDASQRFSDYIIQGRQSPPSDWNGQTPLSVQAKATDAGVTRPRRLVLEVDGSATATQARERVQWEAAVRAARSLKISVTVQGWTDDTGSLWQTNRLISLSAPRAGVQGTFLIAGVQFSLSSSGTTTVLDLRRSDAFLTKEEIAKKKRDEKTPGWSI